MSATFLVTGFEPFAEHRTNSSWAALEHLRSSWPAHVVALRLPVDHQAAHATLRRALDELAPVSVLCTGLPGETRSPRRVSTHVEEVPSAECPIEPGSTCPRGAAGCGEPGTNLGHEVLAKGGVFRIEREARRPPQLIGEGLTPVATGRWPWLEMRAAPEATRVEAVESFDAGQYVCESTYWSLLTYAGRSHPPPARKPPQFAAFLHVPPLSDEHSVERIASAVGRVVDARRSELESQTPGALPAGGPRE
jgi:pyrrolidone-carboxylate peptidase